MHKVWNCGLEKLVLSEALIMGIVNVTPDSFSDGGNFFDHDRAFEQALQLIADGAKVIDVGGESTRPGSDEVSIEDEIARTIPFVKRLSEAGVLVSIDTRHAQVARAALEAGAVILNDISGFSDPAMFDLAVESNAGLCIMHMQGEPKSMQNEPHYEDVTEEVYGYLRTRAGELVSAGVDPSRITLDPGFGFGKNFEHNRELFYDSLFVDEEYPLFIGISRKRFIRELSGLSENAELDTVTAELGASIALAQAGTILRVHNVAEQKRVLEQTRKTSRAYLALGSNLGDRLENLHEALRHIESLPATHIVRKSVVVESEPAYELNQDAFYNAAIEIETALQPWALLNLCLSIEQKMGRVRSLENAPRPIDIDVLAYFESGAADDKPLIMNEEKLTLPHPLIGERDFVLKPLETLGVCIEDWGVSIADECFGKVARDLSQL